MPRSSEGSPPAIVDAGFAVLAVLPTARSRSAIDCFAEFQRGGGVQAPAFWVSEAVSAIRKSLYMEMVSSAEADRAVEDLFALGVEPVEIDLALCRSAMTWAERLAHARAYDGFYVGLAKQRESTLWTADGRLVDRARQLEIDWVRGIEE